MAMDQSLDLQTLDATTRQAVQALLEQIAQQTIVLERQAGELKHKTALIDKLTYEMAVLKRLKFAAKSEALNAGQTSLLQETLEEDLQAVGEEIEQLQTLPERAEGADKRQPKRLPLPAHLPRQEFVHEPASTDCCGQPMMRMGQEVSEKLDYQPGVFTVHRHVRGKWVCACCKTLKQQPVDAHIIDKGLATTGLLAQVLVAKYADHLPLFRQEGIYARAGVPLGRSTLAQWVGSCGVQLQPLVDALRLAVLDQRVLHADETPVQMLKPASGRDGKTHRAYLWAYTPGRHQDLKAVVYNFCESRAGSHAKAFLEGWQGTLVVDDYSGYKQLMGPHITEAGCWAHARRKFFELHAASKSQIAEQALRIIGELYEFERQGQGVDADERLRIRQQQSRPVIDKLHAWLTEHRAKVPEGSATAKAMDYSLRRWPVLTLFLQDAQIPIDNNWVENQIRPVALGRKNWLFAGSLRAGQRAAAVMSLIQSAKLNGHDPHAYLKDVMDKLPTWPNSRIDELLPQNWTPAGIKA
jgi:transposase